MDLGITGRKAIVCAASKGLGRACAFSLARNGVDLVILARTAGPLEATADEIRRDAGVRVTAIAADITTSRGQGSGAGGVSRTGHPCEQCRWSASGGLSGLVTRRLDQSARREHADSDRID